MAGNKIVFKDRVSTNVNRKKLTIIEPSNGTTMLVDVERADTSISELGTPLNAETMNNLLQVANVVETLGTSTTDVMSQKAVKAEFDRKISMQFTDSDGASNYIGKNLNNLSVSVGTFILTNCTGSINVADNGDFKVYITNSPNLKLKNKNSSNWENIWIDGVASRPDGNITKWQDGVMIQRMQHTYTKRIPYLLAFAAVPRVIVCAEVSASQPVYATIAFPFDIDEKGFSVASVGYHILGAQDSVSSSWSALSISGAANFAGLSCSTIIGRWKL